MLDLAAQRKALNGRIEAAIARVLDHGNYIMGTEVEAFESELAAHCGTEFVVSCANGTDALVLVMMAEQIGPGDAVFVPSFTFVATAEAVAIRGATPVFVDVDEETFTISAASLTEAIADTSATGLVARAVIAVDLFGQPANYQELRAICEVNGLLLVADAAQSFGAHVDGERVGTLADYTTTSFFPSKPLGCYGDGGAVIVNDADRAQLLRSLRVHGQEGDKYNNVRVGLNSRLDTIQAAILREKLLILNDEIERREQVAQAYSSLLQESVHTPRHIHGTQSAWAQYTIRLSPATDRASLQERLASMGIPTSIYYPRSLHTQDGYRRFPRPTTGCPTSSRLSATVLSLPMHPYLDEDQVTHVSEGLKLSLRNMTAETHASS